MSSQLRTLRIKIKSLAIESKFIRREELKEKKWWKYHRPEGTEPDGSALVAKLHLHRTTDVRSECRSAQLAYGFLRGRLLYSDIEEKYYTAPDWERVENLVIRFAEPSPPSNKDQEVLKGHLKEWIEQEDVGI